MAQSRSVFKKVFVFLAILSLAGAGCTNGPDAATVKASQRVTINVWGVVDDEDVYDPIFTDYRRLHPFVTINYRRLTLDEYQNDLVNALAEDKGPDIFLIKNDWVGQYLPKILPMPLTTKVAVQTVAGGLQKTAVYALQTSPTVPVSKFKVNYPDAVGNTFVRTVNVGTTAKGNIDNESRVVAIPMSVDTLAMFVNKDLLNAAGIATVPANWDDFLADVQKLTKLDANNNILQSGAAIGTGDNIDHAPDILAGLMMQNGTVMSGPDGTPLFNSVPAALQGTASQPPAYQALGFYTDFANPNKQAYTWNDTLPEAQAAFLAGKTAFYFGYNYDLPIVKAQAPQLNLEVSPLPQISGNNPVNVASFWGWTVSKKTANPDISWDLLNFMSQPAENQKYLDLSDHPAALRSQIDSQSAAANPDTDVFDSQELTAKAWYLGNDPKATNQAFVELIENALAEGSDKYSALMSNAQNEIQQTLAPAQ